MTTRRDFLRRAGAASAAALALTGVSGCTDPGAPGRRTDPAPSAPLPPPPQGSPSEVARDEAYWRAVAERYAVGGDVTNLEAGYFGMMAAPVLAAHHRHIDRVNRESSWFARTSFGEIAGEALGRTASALGVSPDEMAFSRNATEALQTLILQYNRLRPGETVLYADLDYPAMQEAMNALAARVGATVATLDLPEPASRSGVLDAYAAAFDAHPRTRLLLLTHANNKTGLIHPVSELVAMAEARGIDVVVDAAHSFGQVPLSLPELGAPFVGVNLHKWVGAPVGVGALYIRRDQLEAIDRAPGEEGPLDETRTRIHTGTTSFATVMTVPDALDFQEAIGVTNKSARLRYLRDSWAVAARRIRGIDVLTPDDPELVCALTSFRLHGDGSREGNRALARALADEFGLFTVHRTGLAGGDCVRVTPSLYNTPADGERLVAALEVLAARG